MIKNVVALFVIMPPHCLDNMEISDLIRTGSDFRQLGIVWISALIWSQLSEI